MRTAIILAAGCGSRIRNLHADAPKGFIEIGHKPIIEHSIGRLRDAGISRIIIVTCYASDHYFNLARKYEDLVEIIHNNQYERTGSLYSFYCLKGRIDEPFLLLESDLLYESRALTELLRAPESAVILLSSFTHSSDEVYVSTRKGKLLGMSKNRADLGGEEVPGEFVGITKISMPVCNAIMNAAEAFFPSDMMRHYDVDGLVAAARTMDIPCLVAEGLIWAEIDDETHFHRARDIIYPQL